MTKYERWLSGNGGPIYPQHPGRLGMIRCARHGWVACEHTCRRPGETASEYTGRVLGERRDV